MEHSAIVNKNSVVTIFTFTEVQDPFINVYKLEDNGAFSNLAGIYTTLQLQPDYYKTSFVVPDEDCYLCILFGDFPTFVRVGEPLERILYYGVDTSKSVSFRQIDPDDGSILDNGTLSELGHGFYNQLITDKSYSLMEISDPDGYVEPNVLK